MRRCAVSLESSGRRSSQRCGSARARRRPHQRARLVPVGRAAEQERHAPRVRHERHAHGDVLDDGVDAHGRRLLGKDRAPHGLGGRPEERLREADRHGGAAHGPVVAAASILGQRPGQRVQAQRARGCVVRVDGPADRALRALRRAKQRGERPPLVADADVDAGRRLDPRDGAHQRQILPLPRAQRGLVAAGRVRREQQQVLLVQAGQLAADGGVPRRRQQQRRQRGHARGDLQHQHGQHARLAAEGAQDGADVEPHEAHVRTSS
jgi:hypothetical protein